MLLFFPHREPPLSCALFLVKVHPVMTVVDPARRLIAPPSLPTKLSLKVLFLIRMKHYIVTNKIPCIRTVLFSSKVLLVMVTVHLDRATSTPPS